MNILDRIKTLVRWCCQKIKPHTTVTPVPRQTYVLSAAASVFLLTTNPATLTYTAHTPTNYTLTAQTGSFLITGKDAGLARSTHALGASKGTLLITGKPATLRVTRYTRATKGTFTLAGQSANLKYGRKVGALAGAFTINGKASTLGYTPHAYPEAIIDAPAIVAYDLLSTGTGPRGPTTKTIGIDTLPIGVSDDGTTIYIGSSVTMDNWDLRGRFLYIAGNVTVTLNDALIRYPSHSPWFYGMQVGDDSTTPTVNLNYCDIDGSLGTTDLVGIGVRKDATLNATNTYMHHMPSNHGKSFGYVTLTRCWLGSYAQNVGGGGHYEAWQAFLRTFNFITSIADTRTGTAPAIAPSAVFFYDTSSNASDPVFGGTVSGTISGSAILGFAHYAGPYPIYLAGNTTWIITLTLTANVIEVGNTGFYLTGGGLKSITRSGNLAFADASNIDSQLTF